MSNAQYESMKDAFEDKSASERIGIYYNAADGKYAIVVRMPEDNRPLLAGVGAAIGAAGLGLGALARNGVTIRGKSKWIEAYEPFVKDAHLFVALLDKFKGLRLQVQGYAGPPQDLDSSSDELKHTLSLLESELYSYIHVNEKHKEDDENRRADRRAAHVQTIGNLTSAIVGKVTPLVPYLASFSTNEEDTEGVSNDAVVIATKVLKTAEKIQNYEKSVALPAQGSGYKAL
jgi:hypothetical protein